MKKGGVLHPLLAQVVASLGHGDLLVVADAGLPIPPGPLRIDLAYAPGRPLSWTWYGCSCKRSR